MRLLASLCLVSLLSLPAHAQIVNGGFEPAAPFSGNRILAGGSTAIPGWITTDTGAEWFRPALYGGNTDSPAGGYIVDVANYTHSQGGVQQTFATTPGQAYEISFYIGTQKSDGRDGTCEVLVSADGTTQTVSHTNLTAHAVWALRSFLFVADDTEATLSFRCLQNAWYHYAYIDGVGAQVATPVAAETWGRVKAFYRR